MIELEYADRAVPDDGASALDDIGECSGRLWADVENHVVLRDIFDALGFGRRGRRKFFAAHHIDRNRHRCAACGHHVDDGFCVVGQFDFRERSANRQFLREQEGIGDTAADNQLIDFVRERFEDGQFARDFRAGDDGDHRSFRCFERRAQRIQLGR